MESDPSTHIDAFCISLEWQVLIECYDAGQYYFIHNTQPPLAYIHIHENDERVFVETITNGQNDFMQSPENVNYLLSQSHPGDLPSASDGEERNLGLTVFVSSVILMALIQMCIYSHICVYVLISVGCVYVHGYTCTCVCLYVEARS